jgi:hypothetical protein
MTTYEELLKEVRIKLEAFNIRTAKKYIPKLWEALKNENPNLTRKDLRDKIEKDCLEIWSERRILEALPDEAKDQKKQKFGRLSQKKRISAAESAAPSILKKEEIIIDTYGNAVENSTALPATVASDSHSPPRFNKKENRLNYESDHIQLEFSMPLKETIDILLGLKAWNQGVFWLKVVFDKHTSQVTSATIGEKSRQILDQNSQE